MKCEFVLSIYRTFEADTDDEAFDKAVEWFEDNVSFPKNNAEVIDIEQFIDFVGEV